MANADEKLAALERRLAELEDRMAILQLIASYGPAVDGLDREGVAALWAEDGSYDFSGTPLQGRDKVADLIDLDTHRAYVSAGSSHILSLPRVTVEGDRAVAVNYSQVFVKDGASWRADRTSANRWDLARTADGWRVTKRTNRLLDGSPGARDLLQRS
ncbi:MAG: nuclear transport factor 2 family protein [Rhizobiaceae bacterium]|nr:nuclear transport factor 2 family protein [Rhizobiaceae bacterium]